MSATQQAVTRRAGIVGLGTMASRVLGLVRESVIAAYFPKEVIDAYQIAFMIPNSFRRLTAEGAFSISLVSVFSKLWSAGDLDASRRFVRATLGFALLFLTALTGLGVFGADLLVHVFTLGDDGDPQKLALAVGLTRVMFPYIFLISLMAFAMGLLNSTGRFFAPAFAPVLLNVAIIGCVVGLTGSMPQIGFPPIYALAAGVLIGGVAQVLIQLPSLRAVGLLLGPSAPWRHPGVRRVLALTGPMVFGAAAYQVGLAISNALAWRIGDGAVMYIQFATRLIELPLAVLVMAISTAALPSLSKLIGEGRMDEMKSAWAHALRLALFVATPAMVAIIVLAEPIIAILYQRGLFTHLETVETAAGLRYMALGIGSIAVLRQTVQVFYAMEQTRVPVIMTLVYIASFTAAALPLMGPFGHRGLCMALSIGATVQAAGLLIVLRLRIGRLDLTRTATAFMRFVLACAPMGAAVWGASRLGVWSDGGNSPRNIGALLLSVVVGLTVYAVAARLLRTPELNELLDALARRRRRT